MEIHTSRFGTLEFAPRDVLQFPGGMLGLEDCSRWILLGDAENPVLGWLQSASHADVALAVVSPRQFVPGYKLRVNRSDLNGLSADGNDLHVLVVLSRHDDAMTINLKAPLLINLKRHLGRQVISNADVPVRYELYREPSTQKRAA